MSKIQPLRAAASSRAARSAPAHSASGPLSRSSSGRAEVGAPVDVDAVGRRASANVACGVEHHDDVVDASGRPIRSSRAGVICTARPTRLSGIRWRAVSAWTRADAGDHLVLGAGRLDDRRASTRTATGRPTTRNAPVSPSLELARTRRCHSAVALLAPVRARRRGSRAPRARGAAGRRSSTVRYGACGGGRRARAGTRSAPRPVLGRPRTARRRRCDRRDRLEREVVRDRRCRCRSAGSPLARLRVQVALAEVARRRARGRRRSSPCA